jgi:hypothetical protein
VTSGQPLTLKIYGSAAQSGIFQEGWILARRVA